MKFLKEVFGNLKFTWRYVKDQKFRLLGYSICNIFAIAISIVVPIISAKIIVFLTNNMFYQLIGMAVILFFIENLRNAVFFFASYFSQVTYRETFCKLQVELGKSILKLTNNSLDKNSSGVFIQRLTGDTSKIADVFNVLNYQLSDILTNIGIFVAVLVIDYRLFIYLFITTIILGVIDQRRISKMNEKDKEFRKENEGVSGFIGELVRGARDIKMLSAEKSFIKKLKEKIIHLNGTRYEMGKFRRNYTLVASFLRDFFDLLFICLVVYLITINEITVAIALVAHNYSGRITYIVYSYSYLLEGLKDFNLSTSRIAEIIKGDDYPKEKFGKKNLEEVKGNFEFKNVSFEYKDNKPVFEDLSFKVKANSTVAFVGKSGVGKTTIFNLLCKMYDYDGGKITIDGVDVKELNKASIRDHITIISQNPYIFNLSIRDNLKLVKDNLTEEEMIEACKIACLDEFIMSLPDRYDTIVGEGGISTLGMNLLNLAILAPIFAYYIYKFIQSYDKNLALFVSGFGTITLLGLVASIEYAIAGTYPLMFGLTVITPIEMVVGVIEGLVTIVVMNALNKVKPELTPVLNE